jgi:hypothetical protein
VRSTGYSLPELELHAPNEGLRVVVAPKAGRALVLRTKEVSEGLPWEEVGLGGTEGFVPCEQVSRRS